MIFVVAMGAGKSKKEAKHQAARNLIDKLTGVQIADQILPPTTNGNKEYAPLLSYICFFPSGLHN